MIFNLNDSPNLANNTYPKELHVPKQWLKQPRGSVLAPDALPPLHLQSGSASRLQQRSSP